ncbi:uncharacterized protein LOC111497277 [Cucurbita maxima]|uniref:Uncharacterized protein LOC111497277 n=1 Tax=Cucurbita maxima TaxID=3661 RepID=A0A6J1KSU0_CUCMA|nr:uncharacterized protein LOC111497277 [Cucurbita maxima]
MATKSRSANSKLQSVGSSRKCLCSPTTHPGSFRCSFHRNRRKASARSSSSSISAITSAQLELTVFAKANAVRAFLLHIIRPSSNDLQRRRNFLPRPSRFCLMNKHGTGLAVS